jgi:hypothetical protein
MDNIVGKQKVCPRCQSSFVCNRVDIEHCSCYGIILSAEALMYISDHYDDCLCSQCLKEIASKFREISKQ